MLISKSSAYFIILAYIFQYKTQTDKKNHQQSHINVHTKQNAYKYKHLNKTTILIRKPRKQILCQSVTDRQTDRQT